MNFDFLLILTGLMLISGLIWLVDALVWKKQRASDENQPKLVEYARSFFPVFLIVLIIRSFIGQIFHVPTGSLEPTVAAGDFIVVSQYNYGFRLPVTNKIAIPTGKPKRGDIVVFHWPVNPSVDFVKRTIGLPGDHVSYIDKVLYINGKAMPQKLVGYRTDDDADGRGSWPVKIMQEDLDGIKHDILVCVDPQRCPSPTQNFYDVVVPKGQYLMMGDNRDNSEDGRSWGFVPASDLVGKAQFVLFSWNAKTGSPRWGRIAHGLK